MSLLNPIVFEEIVMSDEDQEATVALAEADKIYAQLRETPGKWAKFGEVIITGQNEKTGRNQCSDEDYVVSTVHNALIGLYHGLMVRPYPRCEVRIQEVGSTKHYYAKYRKMFH